MTTDAAAGSVTAACALCGNAMSEPGARFCCVGCARIADILAAAGYVGDPRRSAAFQAAQRRGLIGGAAEAATGAAAAGERAPHRQRLDLSLGGLWCPSCAWLIEAVLQQTPGVLAARAVFINESAEVHYDPTMVDAKRLIARVRALGYRVQAPPANHDRELLIRLGAAAVLAMNVMMLSYAFYVHHLGVSAGAIAEVFPWILLALSSAVVFGAGAPILRRGWLALRAGGVTMDTLITTGALSALLFSVVATVRGSDAVYYDLAASLITFWLLGRFIEQGAFRRAAQAGERVRRLLPRKALRVEGGRQRWVGADQLAVGDNIRVGPGERVPVDGQILSPHATVCTGIVDGEAKPRTLRRGERVPGGAVNGPTTLDIEVTAPASASLLARVADHVARASGQKGRAEEVTDALARLLLPAVLAVAAVTAAAWLVQGMGVSGAFERGLAVLVVSCPCALGIAAPLARVVSAGFLARQGVVIRTQDALERLAEAECIALDKTGTLTQGRMTLLWSQVIGASRDEALAALAALEQEVGHPIAEAVRVAAQPIRVASATDVRVAEGCGVSGRIGATVAYAGQPGWVASQCGPIPESLLAGIETAQRAGHTAIVTAFGEGARAAFVFGDPLRAEAGMVLAALKAIGLVPVILSGDAPRATDAVAQHLGVLHATGNLRPEEKARWLANHEAGTGRRAVFVGDGINDAPALAVSVGVAVASGTDFARETADVLLLDPGLGVLPVLIGAARRARRIIRQNLAWAAGYNVVAIPLAAFGRLDPVFAAAAMVASSIVVMLNTLRLGLAARSVCP